MDILSDLDLDLVPKSKPRRLYDATLAPIPLEEPGVRVLQLFSRCLKGAI